MQANSDMLSSSAHRSGFIQILQYVPNGVKIFTSSLHTDLSGKIYTSIGISTFAGRPEQHG